MYKTIIICTTVFAIILGTTIIQANKQVALKEKFTDCLDTIMTKAIEANKPISATEAKNTCTQSKHYKKTK